MEQSKKVIPIFYASDKNYIPYLAVSILSVRASRSKDFNYKIHVLCAGELNGQDEKIKGMEEEGFSIEFIDVEKELNHIGDCIVCRDYYTPAIFYRLLIPQLFPQYDKVLYLDCDTIALADVAELYNIDIEDHYLGAVADQVVATVPEFCNYTKKALGIDGDRYFNSGVIVMNLNALRTIHFYEKFCSVLRSYHFVIAPDQDVLNLICKDKVFYYGSEWNKMPFAGNNKDKPKLIHYNLYRKPWHYDGVDFEEYFWSFASKTAFFDKIQQERKIFTPEMAKKDLSDGQKLLVLAQAEADNPGNYIRTVGRGL